MEKRKNPGLGIRELHKMGIDGKGRNIALIVDSALRPHLEYRESLADYVDLHQERDLRNYAGWEVAVLAGKNCGVAPKAKVYCYTLDSRYNRVIFV